MRRYVSILLLMLLAHTSLADIKFSPMSWASGRFQVNAGACYYRDTSGRYGAEEDMGAYAQLTILEWERAYMALGWTQLFDNSERSRPEFSLNTEVADWWEQCPKLMNWQFGAYWNVGPYNGGGVQVGLINMKW